MAGKLIMLKDITTKTHGWTAQVMVVEKGFPRIIRVSKDISEGYSE